MKLKNVMVLVSAYWTATYLKDRYQIRPMRDKGMPRVLTTLGPAALHASSNTKYSERIGMEEEAASPARARTERVSFIAVLRCGLVRGNEGELLTYNSVHLLW